MTQNMTQNMTSADAIDQEILEELRQGKKIEPSPELKPIVDAVVNASLAKAKGIKHNCGRCNYFRSESITKTLKRASKMLKERKAGSPSLPYIISKDVYKFLQAAEKDGH